MEAAVRGPERKLDSDKAQRILAAMRERVGRRGAAGSTFDHVAQAAGVSRGLLHYYFGSKERLLVEVVRRDSEVRMHRLEEHLATADSIDAIVDVLVRQLEDFVADDTYAHAIIHELFSVSRHNDEVREELAELYRKTRDEVADVL